MATCGLTVKWPLSSSAPRLLIYRLWHCHDLTKFQSITTKLTKFTLSPCSTMPTLRVCYIRVHKSLVIIDKNATNNRKPPQSTSGTRLLLGVVQKWLKTPRIDLCSCACCYETQNTVITRDKCRTFRCSDHAASVKPSTLGNTWSTCERWIIGASLFYCSIVLLV